MSTGISGMITFLFDLCSAPGLLCFRAASDVVCRAFELPKRSHSFSVPESEKYFSCSSTSVTKQQHLPALFSGNGSIGETSGRLPLGPVVLLGQLSGRPVGLV